MGASCCLRLIDQSIHFSFQLQASQLSSLSECAGPELKTIHHAHSRIKAGPYVAYCAARMASCHASATEVMRQMGLVDTFAAVVYSRCQQTARKQQSILGAAVLKTCTLRQSMPTSVGLWRSLVSPRWYCLPLPSSMPGMSIRNAGMQSLSFMQWSHKASCPLASTRT